MDNQPICQPTLITEKDLAEIYEKLGGDVEFRRTFGYVQFAREVINLHSERLIKMLQAK